MTDRPFRWYSAESPSTRGHVALRWMTCPIGPIETLLPVRGTILDWGCGHGVLSLWAAHGGNARTVHGVDIDEDKIAAAKRATARAGLDDRVSFSVVGSHDDPNGQWDAVIINDVLYLLEPARQREMVEAAAASLSPGGFLVIKDMADSPRWKVLLNRLQERIVVGLLAITASEDGPQRPPEVNDLTRWMGEAGLTVHRRPMDRHYHCAHIAVVGRRPTTGPDSAADSGGQEVGW